MARKFLPHNTNHSAGLDAPRNSFELQLDNYLTSLPLPDIPYSYQVEHNTSAKYSYPPMKKLIHDEISKPPTKIHVHVHGGAPSIVARLMGVDMLPLHTNSVIQPLINNKYDNTGIKTYVTNPSSRLDLYIDNHKTYTDRDRDRDRDDSWYKYGKAKPRQHPQEEELQKFKKDFEAWQAHRFRECSRLVEPPYPLFSPQNLNKEITPLRTNSARITEKPNLNLQHHRNKSEIFTTEQKDQSYLRLRSRTLSRDFEHNYDHKRDKSCATTRIVILKPGPDRISDHEECWTTSSSGAYEERGCIEDFLEEVKERLKCELQGKTIKKGGSIARGSGIETPYSERASDPKQIARHIAKHVRDSVEINLRRSESTRSCRSEIHSNGLDSPEFIHRDTKSFLSERLRNVLKRETNFEVNGRSRSPMLINKSSRLKHVAADPLEADRYWEIVKDDDQSRSFRHGDDVSVLSPRSLIRSLSAPVSGTSFGKLLLEDRHVLTGGQIRRKHESTVNRSAMVNVGKEKKEKFNFKEKVSNFRYSLRGRLFGKKFQSFMESQNADLHHVKDIMSGPTVVNFSERLSRENSTEVPPSPASVCSSAQEDFWRPADNLSPASTPEVNFEEDNAMPHFFREISSNLIELRRKLNELESFGVAQKTFTPEPMESEIVDYAEIYVRDLLVASGLYHGSLDKTLSRWDPLAKPISKSVFEEVEESYRKLDKDYDRFGKDEDERRVEHKILFDLLNEALSVVLGPKVHLSRFRRKIIGSSTSPAMRGRKLLDSVWGILCEYLHVSPEISELSLENLVACDLEGAPWSGLMDEEINALGRELEGLVIDELIDDIVKDIMI
ncbi:hypothetical protein ACFE04_026287 [Oxalis oulophora]